MFILLQLEEEKSKLQEQVEELKEKLISILSELDEKSIKLSESEDRVQVCFCDYFFYVETKITTQ